MNYQHKAPASVIKIFEDYGESTTEIDYYAWPQTFGSTCGPRKGIGGQAMTSFTVEAYVNMITRSCVYVCAEMFHYSSSFRLRHNISSWWPLKDMPTTSIGGS